MALRVVFMGTPEFAVPCLNAVMEAEHEVLAVVSQPSKPAGRGQLERPPPVAEAGLARGLPVYQWPRLSDESYGVLKALAPDVCVVVAYGRILPQRYLDLPVHGCLNVHASLLPRWRGAAPIQWSVIEGDSRTGVCIMRMEAGLDTGPVARRATTAIGPDETAGDLHDRLSLLGAETLVATLADVEAGRVRFEAQPEDGVTYAARLEKSHGLLDWTWTARRLHDRVRGTFPGPGAYVDRADGPLKILGSRPSDAGDPAAAPGTILAHEPDGPRIACGTGALVLTRLQRAGRKALAGAEFLRGAPDFTVGERL
jgi:methionyl-tRNA formyltransferase